MPVHSSIYVVLFGAGEFWCPLCRQLSNTTLPIVPEVGPALVDPFPCTDRHAVQWIARYLATKYDTPVRQLSISYLAHAASKPNPICSLT